LVIGEARLTAPGFFITLNQEIIELACRGNPKMEKHIGRSLVEKFKSVLQGPDADLLIRFVDLLYHREEGYDDEPLTPEDWLAIREGKEAIRRGEFISLEELEKELGS
jgi:hypothetical protein